MYKVIVIKEEDVKVTKRNWEKVADTGNKKDKGPVYDYATYEDTERQTTQVYEQRVEDIDLPAVINAVNSKDVARNGTQRPAATTKPAAA